jgi:hypothetical protein
VTIKTEVWALVPLDGIIQLKPLSHKGFSYFKAKSSKSRNQKGFRAFSHSTEPVPVLSRSAVHQVTLAVQNKLDSRRLAPIGKMPKILIVDGVWVEIQYTRDEFKEDRSGHMRQCREAEERVVLAALAVWEDGSYEMLHYEIATEEGEAESS